ncbi:MAG: hypothetical protein ACYC4Q_09035 [Victivallaceae bacterium]
MGKNIYWDPKIVADSLVRNGKVSPALLLGHELVHAQFYDKHQLIFDILTSYQTGLPYDDLEERRVIEGVERNAAKTLCEGSRYSHYGVFYPVSGPLSR